MLDPGAMRKILLAALVVIFTIVVIAYYNSQLEKHRVGVRHIQRSLEEIAEKRFPAVVIVKVMKNGEKSLNLNPYSRQLYRNTPQLPPGAGSGFFIREDGYILTVNHVVKDSSAIKVLLHDGREFNAEVVGVDWKTDLAVLKITNAGKEKFPVLKFTDSDKVKVGHFAIAVGAPYSFNFSMTLGVVSQKGRSAGMNMYENYIQTDALINPGNSGGPLLNIKGDVIGVNDFIVVRRAGTQMHTGMGFAIPSKMASEIAEELIKNGEVTRPWLGVTMMKMPKDLLKKMNIESGVIVREVFPGHPSDVAGLKAGDIIMKVGNKQVSSPREVQFAILDFKPNEKIPLTIIRNGNKFVLKVIAGRQKNYLSAGGKLLPGLNSSGSDSGATANLLIGFGLKLIEKPDGVYISGIKSGSPAAMTRIKPGMKVHGINQTRINTLDDAKKAAGTSSNQLLLYIDDKPYRHYIVISK